MYSKRISAGAIGILAGCVLIAAQATAQTSVPRLLSYQGVLSDAARTAVPDGQYPVTFRIYDAATGGTLLWEEKNDVQTTSGIFDVILGTTVPLTLPFNDSYWFALELQGEPEMTPRIRFVSTPYAFHAVTAGNAMQLDPNAGDVVHTLNGLDGRLTIAGSGQASVVTTGGTITVVVPQVLPANPADGQIVRWNAATSSWEAVDISVSTTPRFSGDGSPAAPLDIAQMGAVDRQPLVWNDAAGAWAPGEAGVRSVAPLQGDGSLATPLGLEAGDATGQILFWNGTAWIRSSSTAPADGESLVWDATVATWSPAPHKVVTAEEATGDGTSADPIRLASQGATAGQVLRWDDASGGWRPGPSVDVLTPPLAGTGAPGDPIGFIPGDSEGQLLYWDGATWVRTASVMPNDGELLRWNAATGQWEPAGIEVSNVAPLTSGSVWYGDATDKAAELAIGTPNQVLIVDGAGTGPVWSSDLDVETIDATTVRASGEIEGATLRLSDDATIGGDATVTGDLTVNGTAVNLPNGSVDNAELANSSVNVNYGTGLAGDASVSLGGTLNVQNTGVTSIIGTANQVIVDQSTGAITLSAPQDIHTDATPTFDGVILDNLTAGSVSNELLVTNGGTVESRSFASLHPGGILPAGTSANTTLRWDGTAWVENTNVTADGVGNVTVTGELEGATLRLSDDATIGGDATVTGDLTVNGTAVNLPNGSVDNAELANSSVNVNYGTGLSGDASVALGGTLNVQNTGVTAAQAGTGISVDQSTGIVTITNTGVTSLTGTPNRVIVDQSTGAVTLSAPQDIHTDATPTFDGVVLDNLTASSASNELLVTNGGTVESRSFASLHPGGILPAGTSANTTLRWDGTAWVENTNVTADGAGNVIVTGELEGATMRLSDDATIGGDLIVNGTTATLPNGSVDNAELANSSVNVNYGTGLAGDASVSLGGTLNVQNTGVTSLTGTANQVIVDQSTGAVTLSAPQDIHTDATPTFDGVILDNLTAGSASNELLVTNGGTVESRSFASLHPGGILPAGTSANTTLRWDGTAWVENTSVTADGVGNVTVTGELEGATLRLSDDATIGGDLIVNGTTVTLPNGSVDNAELVNSSVNVNYGTGLAGDASVALGGTLNVQNTGVTSITGTPNQVIVDQSTGAITLSAPQDIHTDATPTFDGVILDNLMAGSVSNELLVTNGGTVESRSFASLHPGGILPAGTSANTTLRWDGTAWVENTNVTADGVGNVTVTGELEGATMRLSDDATIGGDATVTGDLTVNGTAVNLPNGSVDNVELANSSVNVSYGTGLAGDASVALGGTLNLQNTGVTSLTGTANQVIVDQSTGAVTLSAPQDIHTDATPTFDGVILDNLTAGSASNELLVTNGGTVENRSFASLHPGGILPAGTSANTTLRWDGTAWVENTSVTADGVGNVTVTGELEGATLRLSDDATVTGDLTVNGTAVNLPNGSVDNVELANSSVNVSYGTGLAGDASVALGGTLNVQNTGVTSITGTPNQVIVDQSTGAVTLSAPQDIHTDATPTFDGVVLDNMSGGSTSQELIVSNAGSLETRTFASLHPGGILPAGTSTNTTLRWDGTAWVENTNVTADGVGNVTVTGELEGATLRLSDDATIGGDLIVNGTTVVLPNGSVDNAELANSTVNVNYGTGLSGDASVALGGTLNVQNTGVTGAQAGTGISVDQSTGIVTITNTGVTSLTGTPNRVIVDQSTGAVTLSAPQDIHTDATPTFDGLTLDNAPSGSSSDELLVSNGGVVESRTVASLASEFDSEFWTTDGNTGTTTGTHFIGTTDDEPFQIHVDDGNTTGTDGRGRVMRYEPNATSANIIGGYQGNSVAAGVVSATIAGGGQSGSTNAISSNYSTIGGGRGNSVGSSSINATIAGGVSNRVQGSAGNATISGGLSNTIVSGDHTTISGGFSNDINAGAFGSTIGGGTTNETSSHTTVIGGGASNVIGTSSNFSTLGGGYTNFIGNNTINSTIGGGQADTIEASATSSTIGGGQLNAIRGSAQYGTIAGGYDNEIGAGAVRSAIGGGYENMVSGSRSVIPGGEGLTMNGSGSFGFLGGNTGSNDMTVSTANTAVFGNTDLWLANNDNGASALRFYEANGTTGAFPGSTNYSSFEARTQGADIRYMLPDTAGAVGDILQVSGVSGTQVTLDWGAETLINVSDSAWMRAGNAGTTAGTDFIGTTDDEPFQIHVDNANSNASNGRGRVMRFEPNATSANIIGGFKSNTVGTGNIGATISGGGRNGGVQSISADYATISGGNANLIETGATNGTISGGINHEIRSSATSGTISGGNNNEIQASATSSTIGGGQNNTVSSSTSTIGGGSANTISTAANSSTIAGGASNSIAASANTSTIAGGGGNTISANTAFIGGGDNNSIGTNSRWSTIAGGHNNTIASGAYESHIGAGEGNDVGASSVRSTVGGGSFNDIGSNSGNSTISGGYGQNIGNNADRSTIGGGMSNAIRQGAGIGTIAGGINNVIDTSATQATIGGGGGNLIDNSASNAVIAGGSSNTINTSSTNAVIGGGTSNAISASSATIAGGQNNATSSSHSAVLGGQSNTISTSSQYSATIGGLSNTVSSTHSTILSGQGNTISTSSAYSTILGGRGMTLSAGGNLGFLANNSGGASPMTIATANVVTFGNTDLWLANNDNAASALRFYEANGTTGVFPGSTNYSSFEAQTQSADIRYLLPAAAGAVGEQLSVSAVSGTTVTLDWALDASIAVSDSAWMLTGNSGTTAGTHFIGTRDDEPFQIHVDNGNTTGTDGRGRVMRYEPNATSANIIGGYQGNTVSGGVTGATIAGGGQNGSINLISAASSTISGGRGNSIAAGATEATIGGGQGNTVSAQQGTIGGGSGNSVTSNGGTIGGGTGNSAAFLATVGGGTGNQAIASGATIAGGSSNTASNLFAAIGGGTNNTAAYYSAVPGGRGLTLTAEASFGFLGNNTGGSNNMTVSTNNVAVFGNTDLWLANNDNGASALRFYEANGTTGAFPGTTNYSSFEARAQSADVQYLLPDSAGIVGDVLQVSAVSGTQVTLDWGNAGSINVSDSAWMLTGNTGTTAGAHFMGTTDDEPFQIHVDDGNTTGTDGRGRVMRYEPNATSANIIGGYQGNTVASGVVGATISGGGRNAGTNAISSNSSTIGGGYANSVGTSSINATISGGVSNQVQGSAGNATIGGGLGNIIVSGDHTTISGGFSNDISSGSFGSTIGGGTNNGTSSHTTVVGGGNSNIIGTSAQFSTLVGGNQNYVGNSAFGTSIGGGVNDTVESSAFYSTIGGGNLNAIRSSASGATIAGGRSNVIGSSATNSAIAGGRGLTLSGSGSFGFLGGNTGSNDMTVSTANVAVFGNTDLWLANNDNGASQLRFYEANSTTGAFPSGTNYTAFQAGAQSADITYTLPTAAPTANGQVLGSTTTGTMTWARPNTLARTAQGVNYAMASTDAIVGATAVGITITLPAANAVPAGTYVVIKDESGTASGATPGTTDITIAGAGTDTIDGAATTAISTAYGSLKVYSDGVGAWYAM